MTEQASSPPTIEVMWRPGCPFCTSLRRGLSRAGVATTEHDIWSSMDAAARVREATGGDETVPTVFIGDQALVNPSTRQVVDAIRIADPSYQPDPLPAAGGDGSDGARRFPSPGLRWTLVVAVVWSLLVAWRPTGTNQVATSDDVVAVEGNAHFPLRCVPEGALQPSGPHHQIRRSAMQPDHVRAAEVTPRRVPATADSPRALRPWRG